MNRFFPEIKKNFGFGCMRFPEYQDEQGAWHVDQEKTTEMLLRAYELGVNPRIDPFMTLSFMALPVIPTLRLTTRGVVDVNTQQYI